MTKPLAFIYYENLLPGSQLVNRLQDLGYRVHTVADANLMVEQAEQEKPMVVLIDLTGTRVQLGGIISRLRKHAATGHIPVLAYAGQPNVKLQEAGRLAGASLVASDQAILDQLPQLLEQVLQLD